MIAFLRQSLQRFVSFFRRAQLDQDLQAEMASHLELAIEENLRSGMSPAEARRHALIQFGGTQQAKELHRDVRGLPWFDDLLRDLRYSLRMLARDPGFAIVVILTLALGVGVNTAFFSVANFIVLRPLPVRDPGQLVVLATREKDTSEIRDLSYADFLDYRKQSSMFSDMLAYRLGFDGLAAENRADRIISSYVTGNYFSLLGIQPAIGRLIEAGEGWTPGADPVVVLGYAYWQRRFGGDPGVVGKQALLNGKPVTIIGVAQKHFPGVYYFLEMDTYAPIRQSASATDSFWTARDERGEAGLYVLARLKPGVSLAQARLSLDVIASRLAQQYPDAERGISTEAYPERLARPQAGAANYLPVLVPLFFLLASLVLLVACINVANLALVRANERAGELALRTSLGAGPVRLLRQLLTENLLLALLGGTAGIVLGMWLASTLKVIATPVDLPMFRMDFVFDWRVFAYALAITILAGIIVGLFSTRILWRSDLISSLHEGGRALSGGRRQNRFRNGLVVVQVAGSMVLLIFAGLFVRMLDKAQHMDLGFDPHPVLNMLMDVQQIGYDEARGKNFYGELFSRVAALPGVQSATYAYSVPFSTSGTRAASVFIENGILQPGQSPPAVYFNIVSPNYFSTMRTGLLRGRAFTEADNQDTPRVAIISQKMAEQFWPGQDSLGKRFRLAKSGTAYLEVVGVARDTKVVNPVPWAIPYFYLPLAQNYSSQLALQIRTSLPPESLALHVEEQVHAIEPALAVSNVMTMDKQIQGTNGFFLFNLGAHTAAGLGALALILAVIGIYGVVSYTVNRRTHEIGVRLALGAQPGKILKMVLRDGMVLVAIGAAAGTVVALIGSHTVSHFLMGVSPNDPLTLVAISSLLGSAALLACYLPARKATRIDPVTALRCE
jgi:predicted permease